MTRPDAPRPPRSPEEARDALLAYAFRALGARALTEAELRTRLARRSEDAALIEEVLRRVKELGYQDDAQVARIEGARRGVGGFRVRANLQRRGVSAPLIQETLAARDPDDEAQAALDTLTRRWPALARKRDPRASAYAFLARRGFASPAIWGAIRTLAATSAEGEQLEPDEGEQE